MYIAFQAQPASPVGAQLDSGMGRDIGPPTLNLKLNIGVRIVNFLPLETLTQEQDSNPGPDSLWATSPEDQRATHLRFSETEPPVRESTLICWLASVLGLVGCGLGGQGPSKDWQ
ncbi:hypothetical protein DSO57_1037679 [Entomophthora muscae]|uniref:Uncharacterized protein n=1 Tax=Entomophthora muscae TaxID=34485 RepID=A0ACC2SN92_9FUNG|nr:hypothetical protein DSO57_1037679 [Entomophthora muscae]